MEQLQTISYERIERVDTRLKRYLYHNIDWNDRLIAILGSRGSGKTTLILQYARENRDLSKTLYLSLDHILFQNQRLLDVVDFYYKLGIRYLFLDEVHKYPSWSIEIKNIYDQYDDVKVVFTGSSLIELCKGQADLSRRMVYYYLNGLSFREFLHFDQSIEIPSHSLVEILENHIPIARGIKRKVEAPILHFEKYLRIGYYPYFRENENNYYQRLLGTLNIALDTDIFAIEPITYPSIRKLKNLLYIISQSVPFKPNISELSQKVETKREKLIQYLDLLERAQIIHQLRSETKGMSYIGKPDKIYLNNPNLIYALSQGVMDRGSERETFFLNQLSANYQVSYPKQGDFLVDKKYTFEVGGKGKISRQISHLPNSFIAADGIELGIATKIPIWLFGFLY
ncbi:MAG TPA: AAA family ATPase [Lunatimonas sp.]|nr:AAA family ATPase [Lunatimonas sp.]